MKPLDFNKTPPLIIGPSNTNSPTNLFKPIRNLADAVDVAASFSSNEAIVKEYTWALEKFFRRKP